MLNFSFWQNKRQSRFLPLKIKLWLWSHISLTHVLKHILRNCFLKESCMALCLLGSTRMSVGLSIKWSVNRSWKENKMLFCIWKFGFKLFISVTIMWLWIYCKKQKPKNPKPDSDDSMCAYVCLLTFLIIFDLLCKENTLGSGSWIFSCFCLKKTTWQHFHALPLGLSAWNQLPLRTLTLRFYLWVIQAER